VGPQLGRVGNKNEGGQINTCPPYNTRAFLPEDNTAVRLYQGRGFGANLFEYQVVEDKL